MNTLDGVPATLTATELGYSDGVTSAVQTQLGTKAPLASPTFTGNFTSVGIDDNADATAITIDSSEKVGIGTTSPSRSLHVNGTTMGPVMEGEMIWSKDFTWASNTSPSLTATGLTYGNLGSGGAIYMFHFYESK